MVTVSPIVAILQARMGSTRLPGKVLKPILNKPSLAHIIERAKHSKNLSNIVVATSTLQQDDVIADFCKDNKIDFFRGDERNVLKRFIDTAKHYNIETIMRLTADNPLVDPEIIDRAITLYREEKPDYLRIEGFPDGLDVEIVTLESLIRIESTTKEEKYLEHVTLYIPKHPDEFKIVKLKSEIDYSNLRFTMDTLEDYDRVLLLYNKLYDETPFFTFNDILRLFEADKELRTKIEQN